MIVLVDIYIRYQYVHSGLSSCLNGSHTQPFQVSTLPIEHIRHRVSSPLRCPCMHQPLLNPTILHQHSDQHDWSDEPLVDEQLVDGRNSPLLAIRSLRISCTSLFLAIASRFLPRSGSMLAIVEAGLIPCFQCCQGSLAGAHPDSVFAQPVIGLNLLNSPLHDRFHSRSHLGKTRSRGGLNGGNSLRPYHCLRRVPLSSLQAALRCS